ncbi:zinc finger protein 497-like isoform X2 [Anguilla rostrata]|uniref:zinc finger protein 497-like isoform X2 n=1 Tax=Anguilla rostrata TaxID=7938 RepID=UPI0030CCCF15
MLNGTLAMAMELDMMEVKQVVVGAGIETPMDLASDSTEDSHKAFVEEEATAPSLIQTYQHDSLQCFQCFITFCNSKAKERHMRKSHREEYKQQLQQSDTLFTCYVCDRTFLSSVELTEHQGAHSKEDKPFKCPHCQESFRTFSEVTSHRRHVCPEKPFACRDCGKSFRGPHLLRTHRVACHPERGQNHAADDEGKTHRCGKCGRGFEEEAELLQHQENHAGDLHCNGGAAPKRRGRPPREAEPAEGGGEGESLGGGGGGGQAEGGAGGAAKGRRGRPPKSAQMAPLLQDQAEAEAEPAPQPRPHACPECEAGFPAASQLRAHRREEHGRRPHPCPDCEESFSRPGQLEAHAARAHGAGRHACPACGKSFGRENSLRAHQHTHASPPEPAHEACR